MQLPPLTPSLYRASHALVTQSDAISARVILYHASLSSPQHTLAPAAPRAGSLSTQSPTCPSPTLSRYSRPPRRRRNVETAYDFAVNAMHWDPVRPLSPWPWYLARRLACVWLGADLRVCLGQARIILFGYGPPSRSTHPSRSTVLVSCATPCSVLCAAYALSGTAGCAATRCAALTCGCTAPLSVALTSRLRCCQAQHRHGPCHQARLRSPPQAETKHTKPQSRHSLQEKFGFLRPFRAACSARS